MHNATLSKGTFTDLNAQLLPIAPALLKSWTGQEVGVRNDECYFINITRGDKKLGSCSINLLTGAFSDFADADFKGIGLTNLYARLHQVSAQDALSELQKVSPPQANPTSPNPTPKRDAAPTAPAMLSGQGAAKPRDVHPTLGMVSASWEYLSADGQSVEFVVSRFDTPNGGKETRPQAWSELTGEWVWQFPTEGLLPLYNLNVLAQRPEVTVLVVEGEKAADAAQRQFPDMAVTTSSQGANNAHKSNWGTLAGRTVIVCPDADIAGTGYALAVVGQALMHNALSIQVKDTLALGWELGADLADHEVGQNFFVDAKPYNDLYKIAQFEAQVFAAAATLPEGECERQTVRVSNLLGLKQNTFTRHVKDYRAKAAPAAVEVESELVVADPEPWDMPVAGAVLFSDLHALIEKHVVLQPEQAVAVTAWIFYSYVAETMKVAPLLLFTSATRRCGKSTLMELGAGLVSRPLPVANISGASIYRVIEVSHPTLLIDEADTFLRNSEEVAGILNSGHTKKMAFVVRVEKDADGVLTPRKFSTFCPKVLGMIGLPKSAALLDRCVMIMLERATQGAKIQPLPQDVDEAFLDFRRKLKRWAQDNVSDLRLDFGLLKRGTNDRSQNNWSVLASVAKVIHPDVLTQVEHAYTVLGGETDAAVEDVPQNLLQAIFDVSMGQVKLAGMRQLYVTPRDVLINNQCLLQSEHLVIELNKMTHESWADYNLGKGLTPNRLGVLLRRFKIKAERGRVQYESNPKRGYRIAALIPVWQRYGIGAEVWAAQDEVGDAE